jgi:excinuclease UvrABC ATPase subunit
MEEADYIIDIGPGAGKAGELLSPKERRMRLKNLKSALQASF